MGQEPRFTGYGRGLGEPLADGRWARIKQKMREPATKNDYTYACIFTYAWIFMIVGTIMGLVLFL